jgi:membrane protease subunit HflC
VNQNEQVLITQFGQVVRVIQKPGLNFKTPFVQSVLYFDKRLQNIELTGDQITLGDQRRLVVDSFTVYRITDPLLYYQSVGPVEDGIRGRLNSVVSAALRDVLADNKLLDVLSAKRDQIMAAIRDRVNMQMKGFGVAIEDVRIRRADLPEENTKAILARMQSERQRVAAQARAEGAEASAKIRADAERERTVLLAEARATADKLRGEGEAEATRISSQAYSQDANFYNAWRTLQAYRDTFESGNSRLVLTPDNDFLRYLATPPTPTGQ